MVNKIALLSIAGAALAVATLPHAASAADYYDEGRVSGAFYSQDNLAIDGGERAFPGHRPDPSRFAPRGPGPVVYDERQSGHGFDGPARGGPERAYRGGTFAEGPDEGDRGPIGRLGFGRPYGDGGGPRFAPGYRAVADGGEAFAERAGLPDVGCTIQQSQSVTPAGWRKIVTHRTCYRR